MARRVAGLAALLSGPLTALCVAHALGPASARAAVFQFVAPVSTNQGERLAYLWIPPDADQVRGVVIGGMTLMEREFAQDPRVRQACAEERLAIVFLKCGLLAVDTQRVLDRLAEVSGYSELSTAPLMFLGHSAGGPQARRRAREFHARCFGVVLYRGGDPGDVDHGGADAVGPGVPALQMIGQFDEFGKIGRDAAGVENWEKDRDKLLAFRAKDERHLASLAVEPGAGHFAWSDRNAELLAMFVRKAARAKIPARWPIDAKAPIPLNELDPRGGWLADAELKTAAAFPPAPMSRYQGDLRRAAWHFDEEMALAVAAYHRGLDKQDQFLVWNDPHTVQAGARNFFSEVAWIGDGQSFLARPAYAAAYPKPRGGQGARWGLAGEPATHAEAPIRVKHVSGAIAHVGDHVFRARHDELAPATEIARVVFMAYSEGDAKHRYTERVGMIASFAITDGAEQTITFEPPPKLKIGGPAVELRATSDAGLPVEFHVAHGPARVVGDQLELAELPPRAKRPIPVKVVAWQFGRGLAPRVRTAKPVERVIEVE